MNGGDRIRGRDNFVKVSAPIKRPHFAVYSTPAGAPIDGYEG